MWEVSETGDDSIFELYRIHRTTGSILKLAPRGTQYACARDEPLFRSFVEVTQTIQSHNASFQSRVTRSHAMYSPFAPLGGNEPSAAAGRAGRAPGTVVVTRGQVTEKDGWT